MINLEIIKGIHPGKVIERALLQRKISKRKFALSINEHPQTLGAIINSKRNMNVELSLKAEKELNFEEGFLMTLQVFFDIKKAKESHLKPNLSKFRKVLFWDTDISKIDWNLQKKAIINRVFSRGNEIEKKEIIRFYGQEEIDNQLIS